VGVWLGLLLLARLDAVFVAAGLAAHALLFGLLRGDGSFTTRVLRTAQKGLVAFAPAALLVAPYLAWNVLRFGHLMPISGALKTSHSHLAFMPQNVGLPWLALLALGVAGAAVALSRPAERRLGWVLAPVTAGLALQALHAMLFMSWAVFAWHFVLLIPIGAIALAVIARRLEETLPEALLRVGLGAVACLLVVTQAVAISRLHLGFTGATREAGEWVARSLPPDALLAMKDSGAFSYFSERGVVNLDGLVNSFAFQEALCRGELREYLESHHVSYVVQHAVPGLGEGVYDRFLLSYPCHLEGGHASDLAVRSDQEVYRGASYRDYHQNENHLVIWRIAPDPAAP
jgi:hypothetical protein